MKRFTLHLALGALLVLLAGCGDDSVTSTGDDTSTPNGPSEPSGTYWSTSVTENGESRSLVEGTRIELTFDGTQLGASAGCNGMSGTFSIEGDVLRVTDMFGTEMGCPGELHAQDDFVSNFLTSSPTITIDGDAMTLTSGTTTMELLDRQVADPDRPLIGSFWEVDGFFDQSVASSFNVAQPAWLKFTNESTLEGFNGCTDFVMNVEVSDGSTGGPIPDGADGELQFGEPPALPDDGCVDLPYAARVFESLRGQATYVIDGPSLTITQENGLGLTLQFTE